MVGIDKKKRRVQRKRRSNEIKGTLERPRVVFSVSNRFLRVQAIDDSKGNTLAYSSTESYKKDNNNNSYKNKDYARQLGNDFAFKLKGIGKETIVFDRNAKIYHGKVKEFCEAMRSSGINF